MSTERTVALVDLEGFTAVSGIDSQARLPVFLIGATAGVGERER